MLRPNDGPVHFIGIGGAGMSPLAELLLGRGFEVSGSDVRASETTRRLADHGARVRIGHDASAVNGARLVVYSTAIRPDNPELSVARQRGLRVLHRSELLGALLEDTIPIAVAGTHGKTTTSSMLTVVLAHAGLDPTAVVGGCMRNLGGHHRVGRGRHFVLEACESDGSFLHYRNCSQVITSLEADHLDQHGTFENVIEAFRDFVKTGRPDGFLVYCEDDPRLRDVASLAPGKPVPYGTQTGADYRVSDVTGGIQDCSFRLALPGAERLTVHLSVPGAHNAMNAAAAFAAAGELGVDPHLVAEALEGFTGAERRFEVLYDGGGILVVDDYAHHPTEIEATLRAAREGWSGRTIAIFQPHLYSRTKLLMDGFARAFADADEVVLTEIYGAREDPIPGVDGRHLYEAVRRAEGGKTVHFMPTKEEIVDYLLPRLATGDLAICIGAGDIRQVGEGLARALQAQVGRPI